VSESLPMQGAGHRVLSCKDVEPLLFFHVCNELEPDESAAVEEHIAACQSCAVRLAEERRLQEFLAHAPQPADQLDPAGILLSQYRSELAEALDDLESRKLHAPQPIGWFRRWMALRPAWSAALLILLGVAAGVYGPDVIGPKPNGTRNAVNVRGTPQITEEDLATISVAGVSFAPSPAGGQNTVQLRMTAERPFVLTGSPDDPDVRRVLTYVVENGQRFDPGVRLDCLDALRTRATDGEVRAALMTAARKDQNPAVRLKALEALRGAGNDEELRGLLVDALLQDANPGVRVEAVNSLVRSLEARPSEAPRPVLDPTEERVMRALENLVRTDPNNYVRLQSAAALRQLAPREVH
jgi:hypothetical protein